MRANSAPLEVQPASKGLREGVEQNRDAANLSHLANEINAEHAQRAPIPATLSQRIRDRLDREGIKTCEDWRALGKRRLEIFGLTGAKVREIDAAVKMVPR